MEETSLNTIENYKYCTECGKQVSTKASACPNCGAPQRNPERKDGHQNSENKFLPTLLLCWFVGALGIHRFYTGHTTIGIIQLLTAGGCGIWTLIDLILIISGNYKDSDGATLKP
jgi:hypothetical protein